MVSFVLSKKIEKGVFLHVTSMGQRKKSESSWGIKPQTFRFCALMLKHWATETLCWVQPMTKFIWHVSCILLESSMLIASCLFSLPKDIFLKITLSLTSQVGDGCYKQSPQTKGWSCDWAIKTEFLLTILTQRQVEEWRE